MDHFCLACGIELVKVPGPGRWPKWCADHRASKTIPMPPEERSASASRAAKKRRETWQRPEMKTLASERAKAAAAALWAGHVTVARQCGHPADKLPSGAAASWCDDCKGSPVVCQWDGCHAVIGAVGERERGRNRKWCTEHVRERKRMEPKDNLSLECAEPDCSRSVRARNVCNMHYKRILRAEGRIIQQPWNDRRRNNHYRRKALMTGADAEDVRLADVIARDGRICGICGVDVDQSISYPDPFSSSLDHIIPLSRGGAHSLANCQLAHLRCNISKGARVA